MSKLLLSTIYLGHTVYLVGYEEGRSENGKPVLEFLDRVFARLDHAEQHATEVQPHHTRLHVVPVKIPLPLGTPALH